MVNYPVSQRLSSLREVMAKYSVDAVIVTNNDPHSSEYSADYWLARSWISGFTGSAGNVVVTPEGGGLWTDGRYYIQAEEQLSGSSLSLFKSKLPETPTIPQWLASTLLENSTVAVDGRSISYQFYCELTKAFEKKSIKLILDKDLITPVWEGRTPRPTAPVFNYDMTFSGISTGEKLKRIRDWMTEEEVDSVLIATLDDVMWTANIRGADSTYCPISEAYILISESSAELFIEPEKLPSEVTNTLKDQGVIVGAYNSVVDSINQLSDNSRLAFLASGTDSLLISGIKSSIQLKEKKCPAKEMKAVKNPVELQNIEKALCMDGVAMVNFMHWLDVSVPEGGVTELSSEEKLTGFRAQQDNYLRNSFRTIAGYAEHGAKMHYGADELSNYCIGNDSFFLVDSGGQYLNGTTDITRTFHFGTPTEQQRKDYTLVLKAVIRLTQAKFLKGSTGANLDILARGILWQHGIDYKCGTGHGVGACLIVHEGPNYFSQNPKEVPLKPGMVITNEPGVYREGVHGVRIENILKVVELEENEFGAFYGFDTMTLAPIGTHILDLGLLHSEEIEWLNAYHEKVYTTLAPYLGYEQKKWLEEATKAVMGD
ncbi:Xaa-Pro aminopeptidase [Endozoicomonas sp. (ex Bugula neritina AB1)]|nr:Xaa-Pro aminopeptidase [Endozoicomonas sp. (ex Bugula neritina AB1)]